ncbi:MAG: SMP-30/gluconolactonase/LRE family protein [Pseudomonadales bacterium]|nr:SMP-30/gluconolactonase/LRE family protein [Pseudomonadales bacterium]
MKQDRRRILSAIVGTSALSLAPKFLLAQPGNALPGLEEISPLATTRDWSGQNPLRYPDPDVIALDPRFRRLVQFNAPIQRLHTGTLWAEGPAWDGVGKYLVWSDIPNNAQMRWIEDDNRVSGFRRPSGNSNGNTFDFQGRQLSCEHGNRRVVRYEQSGQITVIADRFDNNRLNSPNDIVVHPDGGIWFTDPVFGISTPYEGNPADSETAPSIYRVDGDSGRITRVTDDATMPNGLCFSPDYSLLYVADRGETRVFDVDGDRLRNGRTFARLTAPGSNAGRAAADGMRCDVLGNVWAGASPGVQVMSPEGEQIGMIRLPEICANVCFGGQKRNRLFMTASQSLYSLYLAVQGAHIC